MIQRYWNKMTQMKFHLIYLGYHYHRTTTIERWLNIILAVISTGSLAGLFLSYSTQKIWAIVLILSQAITAAKPYLPFESRIRELDKGIGALDVVYEEVEEQWNKVLSGIYDDSKINELIYKYEKQWDKIDATMLIGDSLPRKKRLIEMADKEKNQYFELMFGGSDE